MLLQMKGILVGLMGIVIFCPFMYDDESHDTMTSQ